MRLYVYIHGSPSSFCDRQWDEEEKARQQKTVTLAEQNALDVGSSDDVSTVRGVLHEEDFTETKAGPKAGAGQYDMEAAHGSSQEDEGLLAVLKIVDWWKVSSICALLLCDAFSQVFIHAILVSRSLGLYRLPQQLSCLI